MQEVVLTLTQLQTTGTVMLKGFHLINHVTTHIQSKVDLKVIRDLMRNQERITHLV
jgi:hypothetical protein